MNPSKNFLSSFDSEELKDLEVIPDIEHVEIDQTTKRQMIAQHRLVFDKLEKLEFQGEFKQQAIKEIQEKHNHKVMDSLYAAEQKKFQDSILVLRSDFKETPKKYLN